MMKLKAGSVGVMGRMVLLALIMSVYALSGLAAQEKAVSSGSQDFGAYKVSWKVFAKEAEFEISAATTGWVAIGFEPSSRMKDADFILGYVQNGTGVVRDDFGVGMTRHQDDKSLGGTDNVKLVSSSEKDGKTTLTFRIPLDSGDKYDKVLSSGKEVTIIWAFGPEGADNFNAKHQKVGGGKIKL